MFPIINADPKVKECLGQICHGELYRLVDVDKDIVYAYEDGKLIEAENACYTVWKRMEPCVNCISRRAVNEESTFIKMDTVDGQVFLVCAVPFCVDGRNLSLETIWNVTNHLVADDNHIGENCVLSDLIARVNLSIVQDSYTGLYNKNYAEQELQNAVQDWKEECPLTVIMLDIDYFKEVNDQYGHIQGDLVIKKIAEILIEYAAEWLGTACRVGGDEFLVILHGVPLETAEFTVKQLKERISSVTFGEDQLFHVSVSAGTAEYAADMEEWRHLVEKADQLLYAEKNKRRR